MHICGRLSCALTSSMLLLVGGNVSIRTGTQTGFERAAAVLIAESAGLVGSAFLLFYEHSEIVWVC